MPRVIIIGGGPGGYEAALVANDLGADVTVIEQAGLGGSAVLTDSVPSKTLVATSDLMVTMLAGPELGITLADDDRDVATMLHADLARVNARVKALAAAQSRDIEDRLKLRGGQDHLWHRPAGRWCHSGRCQLDSDRVQARCP